MTVLDFAGGLELLKEHGIRTSHARVVDSAADAVDFAARRAIDLCALTPGPAWDLNVVESNLGTSSAIRDAYRRLESHPLVPGARVVVRRAAESGTDVAVDGRDDARLGRIVEIRGGVHAAHRLQPLGENQAEAMLAEFHAKHGVASGEARTRMLAHLLSSVSEIFEDDAIERIALDPVRVRDNSYDVLAVHVWAKRAPDLKPRLDHHAHDRKGHYVPSGQQ